MIIKLTKKSGVVVALNEPAPVYIEHGTKFTETRVEGRSPILGATMWLCVSPNIARIDIE